MKKGYQAEVERKRQLEKESYNVVRCSGSIGCQDLIAVASRKYIGNKISFDVRYEQVKKIRRGIFYFNERSRDELRRLKEINKKFKIPCFFAIKYTNKGWKIIDVNEIDGKPIKYVS